MVRRAGGPTREAAAKRQNGRVSRLIERHRHAAPAASVLVPGTLPNRLLRAGLAGAAAWSTLATASALLRSYPLAVDLQIPLQATERWIHGGAPYLASSFQVTEGAGQPFLYPPFLLPVLAPFALLPQGPVTLGWALVCMVAAAWACRRLGIPWWAWPFAFAWPPFAEALLGLNVQVLLFAAFVALFFDGPGGAARVRDHELAGAAKPRPAIVDGALGVFVAILKTSQVHPWIYLLRRRRRAALLGVAAAAVFVLATFPLTGLGLWIDWLEQVRRAARPGLDVGGISLQHLIPLPLGLALSAATVLLVFAVPRRHAGAWIGILTLVGSPDLHVFGLLFALPAMLTVRREIGLAAAFAIGLFTTEGSWAGVVLVAGALLLAARYPSLLEPGAAMPSGARSGTG